jgi:hypothetical protein
MAIHRRAEAQIRDRPLPESHRSEAITGAEEKNLKPLKKKRRRRIAPAPP